LLSKQISFFPKARAEKNCVNCQTWAGYGKLEDEEQTAGETDRSVLLLTNMNHGLIIQVDVYLYKLLKHFMDESDSYSNKVFG